MVETPEASAAGAQNESQSADSNQNKNGGSPGKSSPPRRRRRNRKKFQGPRIDTKQEVQGGSNENEANANKNKPEQTGSPSNASQPKAGSPSKADQPKAGSPSKAAQPPQRTDQTQTGSPKKGNQSKASSPSKVDKRGSPSKASQSNPATPNKNGQNGAGAKANGGKKTPSPKKKRRSPNKNRRNQQFWKQQRQQRGDRGNVVKTETATAQAPKDAEDTATEDPQDNDTPQTVVDLNPLTSDAAPPEVVPKVESAEEEEQPPPGPTEFRVNVVGSAGTRKKITMPLRQEDIVLAPDLFGARDNWTTYYRLLNEMTQLQKDATSDSDVKLVEEGGTVIVKDPSSTKSLQEVVDKLCEFFQIRNSSIDAHLHWYKDLKNESVFQQASDAYNSQRTTKQNITVGVSFGASANLTILDAQQDLATEDNQANCLICFPQPNNSAFTFGSYARVRWKPDPRVMSQNNKGRISIIVTGIAKNVQGGEPLMTHTPDTSIPNNQQKSPEGWEKKKAKLRRQRQRRRGKKQLDDTLKNDSNDAEDEAPQEEKKAEVEDSHDSNDAEDEAPQGEKEAEVEDSNGFNDAKDEVPQEEKEAAVEGSNDSNGAEGEASQEEKKAEVADSHDDTEASGNEELKGGEHVASYGSSEYEDATSEGVLGTESNDSELGPEDPVNPIPEATSEGVLGTESNDSELGPEDPVNPIPEATSEGVLGTESNISELGTQDPVNPPEGSASHDEEDQNNVTLTDVSHTEGPSSKDADLGTPAQTTGEAAVDDEIVEA